MVTQQSLFPATIQEKYEAWRNSGDGHTVLYYMIRYAYRLRNKGVMHFSTRDMIAVIRYKRGLALGKDAEGFKINNSYTSRLARDIEERHPDLKGFFVTKELKTE